VAHAALDQLLVQRRAQEGVGHRLAHVDVVRCRGEVRMQLPARRVGHQVAAGRFVLHPYHRHAGRARA
jgi:hypothetical protein